MVGNISQLRAKLSSLQKYGSVVTTENYEFNETLEIYAPEHSEVRLQGLMKYTGSGTAIRFKGSKCRIYIEHLVCANADTGLEVNNSFLTNVEVGELRGKNIGLKIIGKGSGVAYCDFSLRLLRVKGTGVYVTASNIGNNIGYVNENTFHVRWIDAATGFFFEKGDNQTAKFDNNTIYNPGFENVSEYGLRLQFATRNTVLAPRFERSHEDSRFKHGCICEESECSRNIYITSYGIAGKSKLLMNGAYSQYIGDFSADSSGDKIAYQVVNGANGNNVHFNVDYSPKLENGSVYYAKKGADRLFNDAALYVKDADGKALRVDCVSDNRYEKIVNRNRDIGRDTNVIEVSATSVDVTLKMPAEKEKAGMELSLNVPYKSRRISIKKSTDVVSIEDIGSATGLYKLYYKEDNWYCSRIGDCVRLSAY